MENLFLYILCLVYIILNIFDLIQTRKLLVSWGPKAEANIIIRSLFRCFRFPGVVIFKTILVVFVVVVSLQSSAIWVIAGLTAYYGFVTFHNKKALSDVEGIEGRTGQVKV